MMPQPTEAVADHDGEVIVAGRQRQIDPGLVETDQSLAPWTIERIARITAEHRRPVDEDGCDVAEAKFEGVATGCRRAHINPRYGGSHTAAVRNGDVAMQLQEAVRLCVEALEGSSDVGPREDVSTGVLGNERPGDRPCTDDGRRQLGS